MALLSFVESAPRAYRLKASNAASPISTSSGTIPLFIGCVHRCSSIVLDELACRPLPEARTIRIAGVERGHAAAAPSEQCLKLADGCPIVRRPRCANLAQTVCRFALDARLDAGTLEHIAEAFLG